MNSKKKYFLFPKPHCNHFLFLLYFIVSIIKQTILKDFKSKDNLSIPIFKLYIYDIGDFLSLIPYLVLRKKTKSKNKGENNPKKTASKEEINFIHNQGIEAEFKKNRKSIFLNMFLISIFDFIAQISSVVYYLIQENQNLEVKHGNLNSLLIFNIIFLFLFSKILLHTSFHRHHYFSFIIFIICLITIVALDFVDIKNESQNFILSVIYLIIRIFGILLYSLEDVIAKVMFLNYYFSPYTLLLIKALIQFVYLIIFSIPFIFVEFKDKNGEPKIIFSMFKDIFDNKIYILYYSIYFINSFFYNILNFLLIDSFSANHSAISRVFENLGIFLINAITEDIDNLYFLVIRIIMYILLIIASFIFNEFLVINICGLANDTKLFLDYKEQNDLLMTGEIIENDDATDYTYPRTEHGEDFSVNT